MPKKKARKDFDKATVAGVKKEMGKPRVAKSARKWYASVAVSVVRTGARKPSSREAAGSDLEGKK
jgi:hypothetical protein